MSALSNLSPVEEKLLNQLERVIDPELGIDIVNLGLIYGVQVNEEGHAHIDMTLTTVGCPLAHIIEADVAQAVSQVEEIKSHDLELVWYPAWTPERMSRYARIALGIGAN